MPYVDFQSFFSVLTKSPSSRDIWWNIFGWSQLHDGKFKAEHVIQIVLTFWRTAGNSSVNLNLTWSNPQHRVYPLFSSIWKAQNTIKTQNVYFQSLDNSCHVQHISSLWRHEPSGRSVFEFNQFSHQATHGGAVTDCTITREQLLMLLGVKVLKLSLPW